MTTTTVTLTGEFFEDHEAYCRLYKIELEPSGAMHSVYHALFLDEKNAISAPLAHFIGELFTADARVRREAEAVKRAGQEALDMLARGRSLNELGVVQASGSHLDAAVGRREAIAQTCATLARAWRKTQGLES